MKKLLILILFLLSAFGRDGGASTVHSSITVSDTGLKLALTSLADTSVTLGEVENHIFPANCPIDFDALTDDILGDVSGDLKYFFESNRGGVKAWRVAFPDELLRRDPSKLGKVTSYQSDFGRSFDDIATEFNSLPAGERGFWIDHLEFRTSGRRVNRAGNQHSSFTAINLDNAVPQRYTSDSRYADLSFDPAHQGPTSGSRKEAMTGLEAERQQLMPGPITRDATGGAEFADNSGTYWDVKTAPGPFFDQQFSNLTNSIRDEIQLTSHKVLLDVSYINDNELATLRSWHSSNLTALELERIVEVNVNLAQ